MPATPIDWPTRRWSQNPLSPEPLAFLLPAHRGEYRFTSVRDGKENGRAALVIDFMSANRESRLELIEGERGHDDCFDWVVKKP